MSAPRIAVNTGDLETEKPQGGGKGKQTLYYVEILLNGVPALYLQAYHFKAPGQMGSFVHALKGLIESAEGGGGQSPRPGPFQERVWPFLMSCFGAEIARDLAERNHRFLEEALELVQAHGCTAGEAHQLVDYVFGRPVGERAQEAGGVMVTLAALCLASGLDMADCGETELARVWTKIDAIRAKHAAKPRCSALPGVYVEDKETGRQGDGETDKRQDAASTTESLSLSQS